MYVALGCVDTVEKTPEMSAGKLLPELLKHHGESSAVRRLGSAKRCSGLGHHFSDMKYCSVVNQPILLDGCCTCSLI